MASVGLWLCVLIAVRHVCLLHGYQFENTKRFNGHCHFSNQLIKTLGWKTVVFIHNEQGDNATNMIDLGLAAVKLLVYCVNPDDIDSSLLGLHHNLFPNINIVLSGNAPFIKDILMKANRFDESTRYITDFRHHSKWVVVSADNSVLDVGKNISVLENVVTIISNENCSLHHQVPMTLRHHPSGNVFTQVSECGADVSMCYFPNVKYGYNNRQIRVMTMPKPNFVIKTQINRTAVYKGYVLDILEIASRKLNFSYSITEPADGSWGLLRNGSWDGIVNYLIKHECDLAACDLAITEDRASVIDYIYPPINSDGVTVLYRTYPLSSFLILVQPLCWEVYVIILLVTVTMVLLFNFVENHHRDGENRSSCYNSDQIVRALFRQGAQKSATSDSGKVLISFWWMFLITVTGVYSANLAASFSSPKYIHPFKTYTELPETDIKLLLGVVGNTYSNFMKIDLPVLNDLRKTIVTGNRELVQSSMHEELKKVKEDNFALLTYATSAELFRADDCELEVVKENLFYEHVAFAVPKQSTMKSDLEKIMWNLQESGTLDVLWRKWYKTRNSTACITKKTVNPISTINLSGGFIFVIIGIVLASAVLCYEKLINNTARPQQSSRPSKRTEHPCIMEQ